MKKKIHLISDREYRFLLPPASSAITWCCCAVCTPSKLIWLITIQSLWPCHILSDLPPQQCWFSTSFIVPQLLLCVRLIWLDCAVYWSCDERMFWLCPAVWLSTHTHTQCNDQSMRQKDCQMVPLSPYLHTTYCWQIRFWFVWIQNPKIKWSNIPWPHIRFQAHCQNNPEVVMLGFTSEIKGLESF